MIKVSRTSPAPKSLTTAAATELAATTAHFTNPATSNKSFGKFKAYKLKTVKTELLKIFNNKCAYCEMDYGGAPLEVEHFRPKAAIVDLHPTTFKQQPQPNVTKPGYYWLSADWNNLLLSCIDCNRPRTHEFPGKRKQVAGKVNYFPVVSGSARCLDPTLNVETNEQRLLLDPCRDDPEEHLEFGPKGTIRPKVTTTGLSQKGDASIEVYGLQRDPLVRKREARQIELEYVMLNLNRAAKEVAANPGDQRACEDLKKAIEHIQTSFLAKEKPFIAMCRQLIRETLDASFRKKPVLAHASAGEVKKLALGQP